MRSPVPLAALLALVAGCAAPVPAPGIEEPQGGEPIPGVLVMSGGRPSSPYEFTTAILEGGEYQHPRLDAFTDATIIWWNVDGEAHSVVSDDGQFAGSGPIAPGGEFVHTFLTPGDYRYHCRYHADMAGIVVVR